MMKPYPEYKECGIEWIGSVPSHWSISTLRRHVVEHRQGYYTTEDYVSDGIPLLRITDLQGQGKICIDKSPKVASVQELENYFLEEGDFVFARTGGAGTFGLVEALAEPVVFASYLIRFRFGKSISSNFLKHALQSKPLFTELTKNMHGGVNQNIHAEDIKNAVFAYPDVKEQEKISQYLENELSNIESLISEKQSFIKLLQEKRQALISHVVTKGLDDNVKMKPSGVEWIGEIPQHWEVKPIKYLGLLGPAKSEVSGDFSKQCSFVPMEKLKTDSLLLNEERIVNEVIDGYTYFKDGDILFAKVTPCFENKNMCIAEGLTNGIGFGSSEINVFRTNKFNETKFVYYLFQEEHFMQFAKSNMTGTGGLKRVPSDVVLNYKVAVPPLTEQVEIAEEVCNRFARLALLIEETKQSIELLKEHRTALISAAVTGKIDVREEA